MLALLNGQDLAKVEDGLLPVSVLGVWAGGETDRLVACGEVDVEPSNEGVDEVVSSGVEDEGAGEGKVRSSAGVEVKSEDCGGVGDDCLDLDSVHEGLGKGGLLQGGVVEAVDVVPEADLLVLVVAILNTSHEDGGLVGEDKTVGHKVLVSGVQDGVQHGLVEKEVSHPLRDDNVDFREGKLNFLHLALQKGDLVRHSIDGNNLLCLHDDRGHVNTNNVLCASLDGEPIFERLERMNNRKLSG